MYNLKVAIIGAGIGGLTAGIALRRMGYSVEIYDKASALKPAGAGISLWSNGVKVLNWLGLGEAIAAIGGRMDRMEYRTHTNELLSDIDLNPLFARVGQRPYPVSRSDLQRILLDAFGEENVQLQSKCIGITEEADGVTAIFEHGHSTKVDLLIGADGIHSLARTYVAGSEVEPRYADYVNWNGLVAANPNISPSDVWGIYVGEGKRASMMPIGGDRFYFFFGAPMPKGTVVEPCDRQLELKNLFYNWATPVQNLIMQINPLETNRLEISDLDPLEHIVRGRVALLGDSAHASTPTLGQGGCQAMEDAEILCRYLITTNLSVEDALIRYESDRKERTNSLVLKARKRADIIYGKDPEATQQWYASLKQEDEKDVINALAKVILAGPFH
ncbi:2-polyprenyl-6-methoxyphenol hydroxylase-like oxidoreductase [Synechococcus sp. PCC 7502]|uniref:FAD-dependent urate hydroxylase HpxO n=1 Tax=Synechococcus sp. PCC 7502 TaxID=1173263 RepID=UPI00029FB751|nr:FAD-dependent urate hydroxylase HpxO [Synechococcus sp. PCC 7502]AFY74567.1 2-polyprenyl-6-methoxyphenol hydroxylase-like oxidoreductase [Synechococcus sp. PCC 7502]